MGAWVASFNPKVTEYATKAKDYVMSKIKGKATPDTVEIEVIDLDQLSVHELLEALLVRAEGEGDSEGLMLLGAYGKHVYDLRLAPIPTKAKTTKKGA